MITSLKPLTNLQVSRHDSLNKSKSKGARYHSKQMTRKQNCCEVSRACLPIPDHEVSHVFSVFSRIAMHSYFM